LPNGILRVFNPILCENKYQNPQIFQQTISLFPEQSTLVVVVVVVIVDLAVAEAAAAAAAVEVRQIMLINEIK
jgi:hypothetical protein